jgi:hypothetical protein
VAEDSGLGQPNRFADLAQGRRIAVLLYEVPEEPQNPAPLPGQDGVGQLRARHHRTSASMAGVGTDVSSFAAFIKYLFENPAARATLFYL